jgi:hypothetical protein
MSYSFHEDCSGPIRGLYLPPYVWGVLQREGISTVHELRAVADQVYWVPGIGVRTARMIRAELARITPVTSGITTNLSPEGRNIA